jgi:pilus assembly protein CpaC
MRARFLPMMAAVAAALTFCVAGSDALAAASDYQSQILAGAGQTTRSVKLGLNKSLVVELPRDARDVLVSNPVIADAVIRSSRRIYLTGVAVGEANIFVFDKNEQLIVNLHIEVERDITGLEARLNALIEGGRISVDLFNDNIVLSGTVKSASDSRRAADLANAFANGGRNSQSQQDRSGSGGGGAATSVVIGDPTAERTSSVVNMLQIEGEDQVHIKVTIAEVNRTAIKQLGVDWNSFNLGGIFSFALNNPFPVNPVAPTGSANISSGGFCIACPGGVNPGNISLTLNFLEQEGLYRTLAEPTLTAISGESASFLAGGEFPTPSGVDNNGTVSVTFRPFGVSLAFTPVVLSAGRISLRVRTEASELSQDGALTLGNSFAQATIPALKVRRAETTLELPSGGSMIMGGLLQDNIRQAMTGQPGLKNLPVLGTLFRSRDFQRSETELVIIVTPYLVQPTSVSSLARPDDNLNAPSDAASNFLGRVNRMYGHQGVPAPQGSYRGRFGFIFE